MKILIDSDNVIIAKGDIEFGIFDEDIKKWKIQQGESFFYLINYNFTCIDIFDAPMDILEYKYCYTSEKGLYLNENYNEPIDPEEEVRRLARENIDLKSQLEKVQEVLDYLVMQ